MTVLKCYWPHEELHSLLGAHHLKRKERIKGRGQQMILVIPRATRLTLTQAKLSSVFWILNTEGWSHEQIKVDHVLCGSSRGWMALMWTQFLVTSHSKQISCLGCISMWLSKGNDVFCAPEPKNGIVPIMCQNVANKFRLNGWWEKYTCLVWALVSLYSFFLN